VKKSVILIACLTILVSPVFSAVITDGIYKGYYMASAKEIVDKNANLPQTPKNTAPVQAEKASLDDFFNDIATNVNFDVNTDQAENKDIDNVSVNTGFTATKGTVSFQYAHTRNYTRVQGFTDGFEVGPSEFQGQVNNRFSISVNFMPDFSQKSEPTPTNVASVPESPASARARIAALAVK